MNEAIKWLVFVFVCVVGWAVHNPAEPAGDAGSKAVSDALPIRDPLLKLTRNPGTRMRPKRNIPGTSLSKKRPATGIDETYVRDRLTQGKSADRGSAVGKRNGDVDVSALLLLTASPGPGPIPCRVAQADANCSSGGPALDNATGMGQGLRDLLTSSVPAGPVGLPAMCIAPFIKGKVAAGQRAGAA